MAKKQNSCILFRLLNKLSTGLLENDFCAAKGPEVKGKGSDWGPMAGFIPYDTRLGKKKSPLEPGETNPKQDSLDKHGVLVDCKPLKITVERLGELEKKGVLHPGDVSRCPSHLNGSEGGAGRGVSFLVGRCFGHRVMKNSSSRSDRSATAAAGRRPGYAGIHTAFRRPARGISLLHAAEQARKAFYDKPPSIRGADVVPSENKKILGVFRKASVVAQRVAQMEANKSVSSTEEDRRALLMNLIPLDLEQEVENREYRQMRSCRKTLTRGRRKKAER